ncbi:hypothetical protein RB601_006559 [Gaeumannomyces tritici]
MPSPPPLAGLKVLEFAGLAPGPFAGMLLADAGASVLRVDRSSPDAAAAAAPTADLLARRKASVAVDLKSARGVALVRELAASADVLIDPFRPGVLERLGLGPDDLRAQIDRGLIYARITGFRRDGRYADMAGHDINYLAVSGVLAMLGRAGQPPTPPWNVLADFAGGGAALFQGILLALAARNSKPAGGRRGQVVEANMVDGAAYLASFPRFALKIPHLGGAPRGENLLDSGCPFYDTYETAERGRYVAVGALEPQFFAALLRGLGLEGKGWEARQHDRAAWPEMRAEFGRVFRTRGRDGWEAVFDGTDACCTPVLDFGELERGAGGREGDQRPPVGLRETPLLAVHQGAANPAAQGQGEGVPGSGYEAASLRPGDGGEELLGSWLGWVKGRDYDEQGGGLVLKQESKSRL